MKPCPEFRDRLLDEDEVAAKAHLSTCAACAREAAAVKAALDAVGMSPWTPEDHAAVSTLPARTANAWRNEQLRHIRTQRWSTFALVAAAAAVLVLVPVIRRPLVHAVNATSVTAVAQDSADAWDVPDVGGAAFAVENPAWDMNDDGAVAGDSASAFEGVDE